MCGLAGFARHPDAPRLDTAVSIAEKLILGMLSRGHHATGVATVGGSQAFVWKWARPASFVMRSEEWASQRTKITADTVAMIGHTRYATQNNADKDEAAHPFRMGQVCGAHNGIIRNWRELARQHETGTGRDSWIVDSQAAFALLDKFEDPADAIRQLDGYWALTWSKDGNIFFTRADAPLAVAYVPEMLTLFWCSEMRKLQDALREAGLQFDSWEAKPATIYKYDPRKFDGQGSHAEKTEITLHRLNTRQDQRTSGGTTSRTQQTTLDDVFPWDNIPGGFSTRNKSLTRAELSARGYGPNEGDDGRQERRHKGQKGGHKRRSVAERTEDLDTSKGVSLNGLARVVQRLANRVTECEIEVEKLRQENAFLYEVANETGLIDQVRAPELEVCDECLRGEEAGVLLPTAGGFVHESCILASA